MIKHKVFLQVAVLLSVVGFYSAAQAQNVVQLRVDEAANKLRIDTPGNCNPTLVKIPPKSTASPVEEKVIYWIVFTIDGFLPPPTKPLVLEDTDCDCNDVVVAVKLPKSVAFPKVEMDT